MIKTFVAFIAALPEILRLINNMQKRIDAANLDRKVREDLTKINQAFKEENAELLNNVFNSR